MGELLDYILRHEESFRKARLPSLYSDFAPQRRTNPDGYKVNISAWQRALANAARAGRVPPATNGQHGGQNKEHRHGLLVLTISEELLAELESPEWGRPVALGCVIDEAVNKRTMVPLQAFRASGASLNKTSWLSVPEVPSPWQVMGWGYKQLRGFVGLHAPLEVRELVLLDNLKEAATRILKQASSRHTTNVDRIYTKELFVKEFEGIFSADAKLSETDFDILYTYLSRDRGAIIYDGRTIKFKDVKDRSTSISQEDDSIASLKTLIADLTAQVTRLDAKMTELTNTAHAALKNNKKVSALAALRSKKLAERNFKQRTDQLAQLEEVYMKIEQAADQVTIVSVMKESTGVLRGLHAQTGGVETVEDIVEELREEMAKVDELGNVINEAGPAIDEDELDEELESMEAAQRETQEEKEAEKTRQRLVELEQRQPGKETAGQLDESIDESVERLSQMSIDDKALSERMRELEQKLPAE